MGLGHPLGLHLSHQRGVNGGKAFIWGLPCTEYRAGMEHWEVLLGSLTLVQSVCLIHHDECQKAFKLEMPLPSAGCKGSIQ